MGSAVVLEVPATLALSDTLAPAVHEQPPTLRKLMDSVDAAWEAKIAALLLHARTAQAPSQRNQFWRQYSLHLMPAASQLTSVLTMSDKELALLQVRFLSYGVRSLWDGARASGTVASRTAVKARAGVTFVSPHMCRIPL